MVLLDEKLPTRQESDTGNQKAMGRRVLSNIMAYCTG
jgi:hypothetical protein